MKSLRKSLNGNKESSRLQISTPLPTMSKPTTAIMPPQKVIRARSTYKSQAPQQLSFEKGEFFYVLKDSHDSAWYEAHNPVSGARGIVPRDMFEEFGKSVPSTRHSQFNASGGVGFPTPGAVPYPASAPATAAPSKHQVYYAIVMHDFNAERPDELDCRRGDAITVVAQSNREWFVAKPIGKLGRPGLIPVSFVEIHDPTTGKAIVDLNALMDRGDLPKVEEWKRAMLTYKQNSISLGVIDPPTMGDSPNSFMYQSLQERELPPAPEPEPEPEPTSEPLPEGILLSADVVSFHYEMEEYWFRVDAVFQPYASRGQPLPPAKQLILFRIYEDFYEFQVTLLHTFPREAGQEPPYPRILPFMPGPAKDVDDTLTSTRRDELNDYIHGLCALAYNGGRQILEHEVLRQFLALKPGDVMHETDPRVEEIEALHNNSRKSSNGRYPGQDYPSDVSDKFGRMQLQDNRRNSDGSEYEDEGYAPSPQPRSYDKHPYGQSSVPNGKSSSRDDTLRVQAHTQNHHQRSGSSTSFHTQHTQSYTSSHSRSQSRERLSPRASPNPPSAMPRYVQENGYSQQSTPSTTSFRSSSQANSRSRSQSTATMNTFSNPPISAANPQTAFVKIKIFDRVADDLIAIRVHPKVSHSELMDKVQSRLGNDCRVLKYRDSLTNTFVGLDTDEELKGWMEGTDKHVLYAD